MKLSLVFELLLIFILLAFAASKSVKKEKNNIKKQIQNRNEAGTEVDKIEDNSINKYCKCVETHCNCCRDFRLPVVELNGPGCASLMYLNGDKMAVSLSFGKKVITNRTLSSRKPSPVCMPLPGGLSKFCGRVYNIARAGEEFRACLGLELQSKRSVEAAVRVSCFKFGPRGVTSEPADPLPLVPQDEKNEDNEDDDDDDDDDDDYEDDDDDFGLGGGDDEDDDDDGTLDAVNDVDSGDYTGFSLLGEDILGDLFGSTGSKKPKKSNKKQAPLQTTTTTTTRRPRPTRRPSRRPSTRITTQRPPRTTTTRTRPAVSRRPTRRPVRRPTRKPTTESTSTSILTTTTFKPSYVSTVVETTEHMHIPNTNPEQAFAPVSIIAENPTMAVLPATTPKSVTDFEDPGLEMSLAHITGQLAAMPVTPMISDEGKDSAMGNKEEEQPNYEKVQTITPKSPSTVAFAPSSVDAINDDMIQIVQNLDSHESMPEKEQIIGDESRGHGYNAEFVNSDNYYEEHTMPKKHRNKQFNLDDLDVLDLSKIGESLGDELGIFGRNRKNRDNKDTKVQGEKEHNDDYDDLVDAIGHTLLMRRSDKDNKNKKDRRRQNKMMRGEWSSQPITS